MGDSSTKLIGKFEFISSQVSSLYGSVLIYKIKKQCSDKNMYMCTSNTETLPLFSMQPAAQQTEYQEVCRDQSLLAYFYCIILFTALCSIL